MKKKTTIYLIRHGESLGNVRWDQGLGFAPESELGTDLSELGVQQVQTLAENLRTESFDVVYSSHLLRAKRTALAVLKERSLELHIDRQLCEFDLRNETAEQAIHRFTETIQAFVERHPDQKIAVFAHGFVIRHFLVHHRLAAESQLPQGSIRNTGYVVLEAAAGQFTMLKSEGVNFQPES